MVLEDKRKNCYYEFDPQRSCITSNAKFKAFLGKRVLANRSSTVVTIVVFNNLQSIGAMSTKDAYMRQLFSPGLLKIYSFIETANNPAGKVMAFCIMEYVDGISLDKFVAGDIRNLSSSTKAVMEGLYSDYCHDKDAVSVRMVKELSIITDTLNSNGFSIANVEPQSIIVTTNGSIKLLDYGIPTGQIQNSSEIIMLGRMLHFLLTGSEYKGVVRNVKTKGLRDIVNKAIGKKYPNTEAFRKAFDKHNAWWKYFLSILLGIIVVLGVMFGIKNCSSQDYGDDTYYIQNDVHVDSMGFSKEPNGNYVREGNEDTDYLKGLKDLERKQQKKSPSRKKTTDSKNDGNEEDTNSKPSKEKSEKPSLKNDVII